MNWQDDPVLAAHYVIWVAMGDRGAKQPGDFAEALVKAIFRADMHNRARLRLAFPVYVDAVAKYKDEENGYAELRKLAGLDDDDTERRRAQDEALRLSRGIA